MTNLTTSARLERIRDLAYRHQWGEAMAVAEGDVMATAYVAEHWAGAQWEPIKPWSDVGRWVWLALSEQAPGVTPEQLRAIFEQRQPTKCEAAVEMLSVVLYWMARETHDNAYDGPQSHWPDRGADAHARVWRTYRAFAEASYRDLLPSRTGKLGAWDHPSEVIVQEGAACVVVSSYIADLMVYRGPYGASTQRVPHWRRGVGSGQRSGSLPGTITKFNDTTLGDRARYELEPEAKDDTLLGLCPSAQAYRAAARFALSELEALTAPKRQRSLFEVAA